MTIDCYGRDLSDIRKYKKPLPQVTEVLLIGDYVYMRFFITDKCAIHRVDTSLGDSTKIRWAYGDWSNKLNLVYDTDVNTVKEI